MLGCGPPSSGHFGPSLALALAPKVVKKILELVFVEMSEIKSEDVGPTPCPTSTSPCDQHIGLAGEVLTDGSSRFPPKIPEFFAYRC